MVAVDLELEQIDGLHAKDIKATEAGDVKTLRSILSDDAVILAPGAPPLAGREIHDKNFKAREQSGSANQILHYQVDLDEVKVLGDFAYEWGSITSVLRDKVTGKITELHYNIMRILRKENGQWKVYRSMWNDQCNSKKV